MWYVAWYAPSVDPQLSDLLDLLDDADGEAVGTSIRIPASLRRAAALATEVGLVPSTSEVAVQGLRDVLEARAQRAILDAHYAAHPEARPDLGETALAAAELDDHPLAGRADLIRRAAREVRAIKDDPTPDDVLLFAAGLAAAAT